MFVNNATWQVLYFMQAWKIATRLRRVLDQTTLASWAKDVTELHKLQMLERTLDLRMWPDDLFPSVKEELYSEARRLIHLLFWDSRYRALKWEMWRSID